MHDNDLSIYISSCDKYSWLWPSFFHFFNKFWPVCPYKIYLGTETLKFEGKNVTTLDAEEDVPWGKMTKLNLEKIDTKYVLLMLDDFLLEDYVDSELIDNIMNVIIRMKADHVRLNENRVRKKLKVHEVSNSFVAIKDSKKFIVSLQAAIWDRKFLLSILRDKESPWEFEIHGSERVQNVENIYYLNKTALVYHFGGIVHQGLMERKYARNLYPEHLLIEKRNVMSRREQLLKYMEDLHNDLHLTSIIPLEIKKYVKTHLRVEK
jgi:hypothetical protein